MYKKNVHTAINKLIYLSKDNIYGIISINETIYRGLMMNKQQLASKIWESANKMRSKIEANEYKDYILGFIFYKFLSTKEVMLLKKMGITDERLKTVDEENEKVVKYLQNQIGYFIAYKDLFSTWLEMGRDFDVSNVRDALQAFTTLISPSHQKVFEGIFNTLETGLSKLGETAQKQTSAIRDLISLIDDIPMDFQQDYDVLGFIYEYLISNFAANAGKKAGEFYTPHEVSILMSEIIAHQLKNKERIEIYDPTSGSGSLLINIGKSLSKYIDSKDNIKYYAQELKQNTYNLTRMNLVMRDISPSNIITRCGDTLADDWPYFDENHTYNPLFVDAVVSNPPYSQNWEPTDLTKHDIRFREYGVAPKSKADYAFLLHDLYHLNSGGIMTIVLPHGVLFRGGEEGDIRQNLIEKNRIDAIIGLPPNIFFGTGIPTIIMVLKKEKTDTDILIIDASKGFEKEGKNNKLRACDIKKITDTIINRVSIPKFSKLVSRDEIRANEYNLNIPRYVDSSEQSESWDIYASMFGGIPALEIDEFKEYWFAFPGLKENLLEKINDSYYSLKSEEINEIVNKFADILQFKNDFSMAFDTFGAQLKSRLIDNMLEVNIYKEENEISDIIFNNLKSIPLIDKYEAYQLLDDEWRKISIDLEIIQTEGKSAITQVDPNMVMKKKNGKDVEIQEGWKGHIIPFDIVQQLLFTDELKSISQKESRLLEITSEIQEVFDSLTEEEKEKDFVNDSKDAFVNSQIKKSIKSEDFDNETKEKLKSVDKLLDEEKPLKKSVKEESAKLHLKTKEAIENLSEDQVTTLLELKWITPLTDKLSKLPDAIINNLISLLKAKMNKYSVTFSQLDQEIKEAEKALSSMINDLTGNDYDMQGLRAFQALLGGE